MGGKCPHRRVKKRRYSHKTFRLAKFLLNKPEDERAALPLDEELPGMGQYYYLHCDLKTMAGPAPHTQLDADLAAGMGMPDNGPKLMSIFVKIMLPVEILDLLYIIENARDPTVEEYTDAILKILRMLESERHEMAAAARRLELVCFQSRGFMKTLKLQLKDLEAFSGFTLGFSYIFLTYISYCNIYVWIASVFSVIL
ncbi:hypothetical protein L1987_86771 [Smallanthus sonchifolius]|uniref:Uncharacterized protein n=1 Tax=Smallanthus sonchifolius TaxID=185202 RepID=A0ACB8Y4G2_9ASTR|nr:hypothetical protein L1987_86771 [Smallanthus sonchifolius]